MESTEIILAPGAGSGIGKAIADDLLARPDFAKRLADALERGLDAVQKFWVSTGKGEGYWEERPDTRSQLQAAFGIMAHMEGEPVKRIIHQHLGGNGTVDPLAALQESPALLEAARKLLEKAEWKHSGHQTHKAARGKKGAEQPAELVEPEKGGPAGGF